MARNEKLIATSAIISRQITADARRNGRFGTTPDNRRRRDTRTTSLYIETNVASPWDHKPWHAPSKHEGERDVAENSNSTSRGFTIFNNEEIQHESGIEHRVSTIFQARRDLVYLKSQRPVIPYEDVDGVWRRHTADFYAGLSDGTFHVISVKPRHKEKTQKSLMKQIAKTGINIDSFCVVTDRFATMGRFANARHILWSRQHFNGVEVAKVAALLTNRTTIQVWELYDRGVKNWKRLAAIWHFIDLGHLVPSDPYSHVEPLTRLTIKL